MINSAAARNAGPKHAIVVFDTRFGNTEKIAKSLEAGLKQTGIQTICINEREVSFESLKGYDLICIGAPTEAFSAFKPMKEFLSKLKNIDLIGKYAYAFDTKIESRLSGSAAKYIEKELNYLGLQIIAPRESAIVSSQRHGGTITGATLKEVEDLRFEEVGVQVGTSLLAATKGREAIPA